MAIKMPETLRKLVQIDEKLREDYGLMLQDT